MSTACWRTCTCPGAPVICGLVARAFVDLNRAESEMDPHMFEDPSPAWFSQRSPRVDAGLGCIPRVAFNGAAIYDREAAPGRGRPAGSIRSTGPITGRWRPCCGGRRPCSDRPG